VFRKPSFEAIEKLLWGRHAPRPLRDLATPHRIAEFVSSGNAGRKHPCIDEQYQKGGAGAHRPFELPAIEIVRRAFRIIN
jgi:hypothetical protein